MECKYTVIDVERYIREYRDVERFVEFCKACPVYGTSWGCPPFDNMQELTEQISRYKYAYIFGFKQIIADELRFKAQSVKERTEITYQVLGPMRDLLDERFYRGEQRVEGDCRVFFSGRCRRCAPNDCTRKEGKPCAKPQEKRQSLESIGFDLSRTMSELLGVQLKWSTDNTLPEYLMAITAVFTMDELSPQELSLFTKE